MPSLDDAGMSIVARPPVADPPRGSRAGEEPAIGIVPPPLGALLPTSGSAPAPAPTPRRALALDALRLLRRSRSGTTDDTSADAAFARGVEAVRRDLAPIHSRDALVASFAREAFRVVGATADPDRAVALAASPGPVRLAYAIRWLELGDGQPRPAWGPDADGRRRRA